MKRTPSALTSIGEEMTLDTFEKKANPSSPFSCNSKASRRVFFSRKLVVEPETPINLRDPHATSSESRDPPHQTQTDLHVTTILRDLHASERRDPPQQQTDQTVASTVEVPMARSACIIDVEVQKRRPVDKMDHVKLATEAIEAEIIITTDNRP